MITLSIFLTEIFELGTWEPLRREGLEPVGREKGRQEDDEGHSSQDNRGLQSPGGVVPVPHHDVMSFLT